MNILFLTKYGAKAASTRQRFLQYVPFLENSGFNCTISPLFEDVYLEKKFDTGKTSLLYVLYALWRRMLVILKAKQYDLVVLHCEAFPYFPSLFERYLKLSHINYVYDYDDAIFHNYDMHQNRIVRWLFQNKIHQVINGAVCVLAGSEYLANYARVTNKQVIVLPTVIDISKYPIAIKSTETTKPFTIGWIGSPSTASYLKIIAPALHAFCIKYNAQVVLIGSGKLELPGIPTIIREWSLDTEIEEIMQFDVGIMPLPDSPWARGKCGFKLIQYMACHLPVIASPVGVNTSIVEPGKNGYLASTQEEWINALTLLHNDKSLRLQMGREGRKKVEAHYCLQVTAPRLTRLFQQLIEDRNKP